MHRVCAGHDVLLSVQRREGRTTGLLDHLAARRKALAHTLPVREMSNIEDLKPKARANGGGIAKLRSADLDAALEDAWGGGGGGGGAGGDKGGGVMDVLLDDAMALRPPPSGDGDPAATANVGTARQGASGSGGGATPRSTPPAASAQPAGKSLPERPQPGQNGAASLRVHQLARLSKRTAHVRGYMRKEAPGLSKSICARRWGPLYSTIGRCAAAARSATPPATGICVREHSGAKSGAGASGVSAPGGNGTDKAKHSLKVSSARNRNPQLPCCRAPLCASVIALSDATN